MIWHAFLRFFIHTTMADSIDNYDHIPDPIEYILKRPNIEVGPVVSTTEKMWVWDDDSNRIVYREIEYVPALCKIVDEVLVNARDHVLRTIAEGLEPCNIIKVEIADNRVSVWNNGSGIPIKVHPVSKEYLPFTVFGQLNSSRNFDDTKKRRWGGTNGHGAKLANIFSTEFIIETVDSGTSKKYTQRFYNNMREYDKPSITACKTKPYTKITFEPDYAKFGMTCMDDDIIALFKKRVHDIALVGAKVYYNGELIKHNTFTKYVDLYFADGADYKKVIDISNDDWKVAVVFDPNDTLEHQNISFANGAATIRGGTHVNYVSNQIITKIKKALATKLKNVVIKDSMIKENLIFFVDACVDNPSYDTQTKDALVTKASEFGTKYVAPDAFLTKIIKMGVVEQISMRAQARNVSDLQKATKVGTRLTGIKKLKDAQDANKRTGDCTLILTEGDSAFTLAIAGISVVGHEKFGAYPLKGKMLNVREAPMKKILENKEVQDVMKILGLTVGKKYNSVKELRYSKIMAMADQDLDGFHIKGLIINMIHYFWPGLLKNHNFITTLATPIIKAFKAKDVKEFYDLRDYHQWKDTPAAKGYKPKYYKGLGTSTSQEAKGYFKDFCNKLSTYTWVDEDKGETDKAIALAFDKKLADNRKEWISNIDDSLYVDYNQREIKYTDFINIELRAFSAYNAQRSLPNMMDGLKIGQRKIIFSCFKKKLSSEIKVAQLQGYVSEQASYHHGEESLGQTIVGLAQDYVSTNNINLLLPIGQFGTRFKGGKDSASTRYIFTNINPLTHIIFHPVDREIVDYLEDEGLMVEPKFYVPIVPMVLINGSAGIGTGWSTDIPPFDPKVVIENLRRAMHGKKLLKMHPYYRHFTGEIIEESPGKYITKGTYTIDGDNLHITELPIGLWTNKFEENIADLMLGDTTKSPAKGKTIGADIRNDRACNDDVIVNTTIEFKKGTLSKYSIDEIEKAFKLTSTVSLSNMWAWNHNRELIKYNRPTDIIREFTEVRLDYYVKRKKHRLAQIKLALNKKRAILRYILAVIADPNVVFRKTIQQITNYLEEEEYPMFPEGTSDPSYRYLLDIKLTSCSKEKVAKLRAEIDELETEYGILKAKTAQDLWTEDLDVFETAYDQWKAADEEAYRQLQSAGGKVSNTKGRKTRR